MPFRFRLQTVLDLARREQDQKAKVMAGSQQQHMERSRELELNLQEQEVRLAELREAQTVGALDLQALVWGQGYLGILSMREAERRQALIESEARVEEARAILMESARKVQVLERLKERAKAQYLKEEDRREAAMIDELATLRYARESAQL